MVSMKANVVNINGKDHYKINDIFVEFNIGGASVLLTNLFNGDEELGAVMNNFLNENWKEVTAEMRPSLSKSIENILRAVTGRIFEIYPLEQILPDWRIWRSIFIVLKIVLIQADAIFVVVLFQLHKYYLNDKSAFFSNLIVYIFIL